MADVDMENLGIFLGSISGKARLCHSRPVIHDPRRALIGSGFAVHGVQGPYLGRLLDDDVAGSVIRDPVRENAVPPAP
jgi:hypothetical protein